MSRWYAETIWNQDHQGMFPWRPSQGWTPSSPGPQACSQSTCLALFISTTRNRAHHGPIHKWGPTMAHPNVPNWWNLPALVIWVDTLRIGNSPFVSMVISTSPVVWKPSIISRQAAIVQVVVVVVEDCLSTTWPAKVNKWKQLPVTPQDHDELSFHDKDPNKCGSLKRPCDCASQSARCGCWQAQQQKKNGRRTVEKHFRQKWIEKGGQKIGVPKKMDKPCIQ